MEPFRWMNLSLEQGKEKGARSCKNKKKKIATAVELTPKGKIKRICFEN
jgi:hypothetical protein